MLHQLRIDYPGAIHHVMRRGDRRQAICEDDVDRQGFSKTFAETVRAKHVDENKPETGWSRYEQ